uniref:Uncharacterized protein n=1 Tax=Timema poppense TaxID=170557 RepID=A0A7R9CP67_TIMPO|nr:unnamed protein product [Timema poppensis]
MEAKTKIVRKLACCGLAMLLRRINGCVNIDRTCFSGITLTTDCTANDEISTDVTGGSSGIGKCVAIEVAKRGAHVTLIARDVDKLEEAKSEVIKNCLHPDQQQIQCISLDISNNYEVVERTLHSSEEDIGPIYMLVNCAGSAICGRLEDTSVEDVQAKPYNVSVTLALPPDTDTPCFANEEKSKPLETKLISQEAGLVSPEEVASKLVKDALDGKFYSTVGFESALLSVVCSGMTPVSSLGEFLLQEWNP